MNFQFTNSLMNTLSVAVQKNSHLQKLSLINCQINDESAISLSIGLQSNESVTNLDLSGNLLTSSGLECLVDCIEKQKINTLILAKNNIDYISFVYNGKIHGLLFFDLSYNNLKERDLLILFDILQTNKSLIHLILEGYEITQKIYKKLCELFLNNKCIEHFITNFDLNLVNNQMGLIQTSLMANNTIIEFGCNNLPEK